MTTACVLLETPVVIFLFINNSCIPVDHCEVCVWIGGWLRLSDVALGLVCLEAMLRDLTFAQPLSPCYVCVHFFFPGYCTFRGQNIADFDSLEFPVVAYMLSCDQHKMLENRFTRHFCIC